MAFVASDPLFELVWSPKGLSLKSADYRLTDKKTSFLWDVGPSNMVLSSLDSVRFSEINHKGQIDEGKLIESKDEFRLQSEDIILNKSPRSSGVQVFGSSRGGYTGIGGNIDEVNTKEGASFLHLSQEQEYLRDNCKMSFGSPKDIQLVNIAEAYETTAGKKKRRTPDFMPLGTNESRPNLATIKPSSANCNRVMITNRSGRINDDSTESAFVIECSKNKIDTRGSSKAPLPEKPEFTSGNDVKRLIFKGRLQNDICENMGIYKSAVLFPKANKLRTVDQELTIGSKRIETQIHECSCSASFVRYDSSFVNWISSNVKGVAKSNEGEAFNHANHGFESYGQQIITCSQIHDNVQDTGMSNKDRPQRDSKENKIMPSSNFVSKEISDSPKEMLDIIRRLRLSRIDILRWMASNTSLSHLDGFFLRLRLGKWEGLEGTHYYVARITGMREEQSPQKSRNRISVTVGGIICSVESQYVSNHDFLEDELMAWWHSTSKTDQIPTEEDLKTKVVERKKLGF